MCKEGAVRAEGKFVDEVAGERLADVEAGVTLFGDEVGGVLRDGVAGAVDGGGVVDGVAVDVGGLEADAFVHALPGVDGKVVLAGEGEGVFVVEGLNVGVEQAARGAVGSGDDIEIATFGAGVADIENDAEAEGSLDVEIPGLDVADTVVGVDAVVALHGGGGAVVGGRQGKLRAAFE